MSYAKSMMPKLVALFALFVACCGSAFAQQKVSGRVIDAKDRQPLSGATAVLTDKNGKNPQGQSTDDKGNFTIYKIPKGSYTLKVLFTGYATAERSVVVGDEDVVVGTIRLKAEDVEIEEVKAVGVLKRQEQKGDTTVFNADAFKVNPDATTEDLLKKMPGMEVKDGQVSHGGETVKKVLVDGKEFFGSDPMLALKNIDANMVSKIEVYDKQSDQAEFTGITDGNEQRTINILTKMGIKSGRFGRVYGGYGTGKHYEAGGSMNYFRGDHRFTLLGALNNINQQGFSFDDVSGAMAGGGGMRGGYRGGINTTGAIGLNYSFEREKKLRLEASYFYNYNKNHSASKNHQEYFTENEEQDSIRTYDSQSGSDSHNYNHRVNMRIRWYLGDNDQISFNPAWSWQKYDSESRSTGEDFWDTTRYQFTNQLSDNKTTGYSINGDINWNHRFSLDRRTISIRFNTGINNSNSDGTSSSYRQYLTQESNNLMTSQFTVNESKSMQFGARVMYTEPFGDHVALQVNYSPSYRFSDGNKSVSADSLKYLSDTPVFDNYQFSQLLSNVKESDYWQHKAGVGVNVFNGKVFNATLGLDYQKAILDGEQTYPMNFSTHKSFDSFMPNAEVRVQKDKSLSLRFSYRTSSSAPSINQLQNVVDVSNIRRYSTGNEDLSQSTTHQLSIRGSANKVESSRFIHFMGNVSFTKDYIATASMIASKDSIIDHGIVLPRGTQFSKPINMDGHVSARGFVSLSSPVSWLGSNFSVNFGANMSKSPSMYNYKVVTNKNYSLNFGSNLGSSFSENIDFNISYWGNYNIVKSTQTASRNYNYYGHSASADLTCFFANQRLVFVNNMSHRFTNGMGESDQNYLSWNASIAAKLFKSKQGELKLRVNDILDSSKSTSRSIQDAYISTGSTEVLRRFAMLTFTYKFKAIGDLPAPREGGARPPYGMRPPRS